MLEEKKVQTPLDRCECTQCGWDGLPEECTTELEQESWEMPEYVVYLCPKCDSEWPVEFYPSKEWIEKYYTFTEEKE